MRPLISTDRVALTALMPLSWERVSQAAVLDTDHFSFCTPTPFGFNELGRREPALPLRSLETA